MNNRDDLKQQRKEELIKGIEDSVLNQILGPFGLTRDMIFDDKNGGPVTTLHNFKKQYELEKNGGSTIIIQNKDYDRYEEYKSSNDKFDREPYDKVTKRNRDGQPVKNKDGKNQKRDFNSTKKKEIYQTMVEGEEIKDGYTGKRLGVKTNDNVKKEENSSIDLEHITSTKEIETDAKNHLFAEGDSKNERQNYRVDMATDDSNLTLIEGSMNSSKGEKDLKVWNESQNSKDKTRKNKDVYQTDETLIKEKYEQSKKQIKKKQRINQIKKQGKEITLTTASESMKLGLRQAIGLLLTELGQSIISELKDIYQYGLKSEDQTIMQNILERLKRIIDNVISKWKNMVDAFKEGAISGFLSNLATILINSVFTTLKKFVKIIREGFLSLVKAIRTIMWPPEGTTKDEALKSGIKIIAATAVSALGFALEESLNNAMKSIPLLVPISDIISTATIGILSGIGSAVIVYLLDRFFDGLENPKNFEIFANIENDLQIQKDIQLKLVSNFETQVKILERYNMIGLANEIIIDNKLLMQQDAKDIKISKENLFNQQKQRLIEKKDLEDLKARMTIINKLGNDND